MANVSLFWDNMADVTLRENALESQNSVKLTP